MRSFVFLQKPKDLYIIIINIKNNKDIININNMKTKFIGKTKVTSQGQITLPFEAREDLSIAINSEVYWYEIDNCLVLVKELVNQRDIMKVVNKNKK